MTLEEAREKLLLSSQSHVCDITPKECAVLLSAFDDYISKLEARVTFYEDQDPPYYSDCTPSCYCERPDLDPSDDMPF